MFGVHISKHFNHYRVISAPAHLNIHVGQIIVPLQNLTLMQCTERSHFDCVEYASRKSYLKQRSTKAPINILGMVIERSHSFYSVLSVTDKSLNVFVGDIVTTKTHIDDLSHCKTLNDFDIYSKQQYANRTKWSSIAQEWDDSSPCKHCGFVYLKSNRSRSICCQNGQCISTQYPVLRPLPEVLKQAVLSDMVHWSDKSTYYNNIFSMAATKVDNGIDGRFSHGLGNSCVKIQGRIYHFIPNTLNTTGLAYLTYDAKETLRLKVLESHAKGRAMKIADKDLIKQSYVSILDEMFRNTNELVRECCFINDSLSSFLSSTNSVSSTLPIATSANTIQNVTIDINEKTSVFEIAAATSLESAGNRCVSVQLKGDFAMKTLQSTCSYLEPLCYPIFFPHGEEGWGSELQKSIFFSDYLASRFLMPDRTSNGEVFKILNNSGVLFPTNRFQLFARLGQHYIVDQVSRAIDYRANWHKQNENTVFGGIKNFSNNAADMCGEEISNNTIIFDDPEFTSNSSSDKYNARNFFFIFTVSI
jgi:hypothetical protein